MFNIQTPLAANQSRRFSNNRKAAASSPFAAAGLDEAEIKVCEASPYPRGCGLVYDERCLQHRAGSSDHPERPARASAIIKQVRPRGIVARSSLN